MGLGVAHLLLTADPARLFPVPFYPLLPVPGPSARAAAGADFAQIYFGARALRAGQSPYAEPATAVPLGLALAIQGAAFGTVSWEYRAVSLLGLVPALAIWVERADRVSARLKTACAAGFGVFLLVVFRVHNLAQPLSAETVVWIYLVAATCFAALAGGLAWRRGDSHRAMGA